MLNVEGINVEGINFEGIKLSRKILSTFFSVATNAGNICCDGTALDWIWISGNFSFTVFYKSKMFQQHS